jgi:hypothetical protein
VCEWDGEGKGKVPHYRDTTTNRRNTEYESVPHRHLCCVPDFTVWQNILNEGELRISAVWDATQRSMADR